MKSRYSLITSTLMTLTLTSSLNAIAGERGIRLGPLPTAKPSETTGGAQQVTPQVTPFISKPVQTHTVQTHAKAPFRTPTKALKKSTPVKRQPQDASHGGVIVKKKEPVSASAQTGGSTLTTATISSGPAILKAWLNKSGEQPQYKHGEKMQINVSASKDCNVMIFDFDGHGKLTQLFPNDYQQNSLVRAGETISFGGPDSAFEYEVFVPKGTNKSKERIFVYAYPANEEPLSVALRQEAGSPFRTGEITIDQYRKLVNESKVYFANNGQMPKLPSAGQREVKIVAKSGGPQTKLVNNEAPYSAPPTEPNKRELSFTIVGQ